MYVIFENGSHQYRVAQGDRITIDRRKGLNPGDQVVFDKVLLIAGDDQPPRVGTPTLGAASVTAEVVNEYRGKKIIIQKFRRRKNARRRKGHRQYYTNVTITGINVG